MVKGVAGSGRWWSLRFWVGTRQEPSPQPSLIGSTAPSTRPRQKQIPNAAVGIRIRIDNQRSSPTILYFLVSTCLHIHRISRISRQQSRYDQDMEDAWLKQSREPTKRGAETPDHLTPPTHHCQTGLGTRASERAANPASCARERETQTTPHRGNAVQRSVTSISRGRTQRATNLQQQHLSPVPPPPLPTLIITQAKPSTCSIGTKLEMPCSHITFTPSF